MLTSTTRDEAPTGELGQSGCPSWCDPTQHLFDDNDTTLIVVHRSRRLDPAGPCALRICQTVRRFGRHVARSPVTISVEAAGSTEFHSRADVVDYLKELTNTLLALTNRAWPAPAQPSALAS